MLPGQKPLTRLVIAGFLALYGYVTVPGLMFVRDSRSMGLITAALAVQTPRISSPVVDHKLGAGLNAFVASVAPKTTGVPVCTDWLLGSRWQFSLFQNVRHRIEFAKGGTHQ